MSATSTKPFTGEVEAQLRARIDTTLAEYSERLGCADANIQAREMFRRSNAGKTLAKWVKVYGGLNQFRTSLPSVLVHDFTEQGRRQEWALAEYEADLRTLLKRASGIAWNAKLGMVTIIGIGKLRKVHASDIFSLGRDCGDRSADSRELRRSVGRQVIKPKRVGKPQGSAGEDFTLKTSRNGPGCVTFLSPVLAQGSSIWYGALPRKDAVMTAVRAMMTILPGSIDPGGLRRRSGRHCSLFHAHLALETAPASSSATPP